MYSYWCLPAVNLRWTIYKRNGVEMIFWQLSLVERFLKKSLLLPGCLGYFQYRQSITCCKPHVTMIVLGYTVNDCHTTVVYVEPV